MTKPISFPKVHIISVGGAVMHSLAIQLQKNGSQVTGSDDKIYDPSYNRLKSTGLLPEKMGWFPEKVTTDLDCVVLGMHAKKDNPELQRALELKVPIYSYPTFIAHFCKNKHRVVVAGSHGKTTVIAMIMHVLATTKMDFDYLVGAPVPGFEGSLRLSDAKLILIEGDEYPSSTLDPTPKMLQYAAHISVITGISWDHINFYPNFDDYVKIFDDLIKSVPKGGCLYYNEQDKQLVSLVSKLDERPIRKSYDLPSYEIRNQIPHLIADKTATPLAVFGTHNLRNVAVAQAVLDYFFVPEEQANQALSTFKGAHQRLTCLYADQTQCIYQDYAHAPSKVRATTQALKERFPERRLAAILELHTFSSLDATFVQHYKNTLKDADQVIIYVDPKVLKLRSEHAFSETFLQEAFAHPALRYLSDYEAIIPTLEAETRKNDIQSYLFMSSGHFGGWSVEDAIEQLLPIHKSTSK